MNITFHILGTNKGATDRSQVKDEIISAHKSMQHFRLVVSWKVHIVDSVNQLTSRVSCFLRDALNVDILDILSGYYNIYICYVTLLFLMFMVVFPWGGAQRYAVQKLCSVQRSADMHYGLDFVAPVVSGARYRCTIILLGMHSAVPVHNTAGL